MSIGRWNFSFFKAIYSHVMNAPSLHALFRFTRLEASILLGISVVNSFSPYEGESLREEAI